MSALTDTTDTTYRHVLLTEGGEQVRFLARPGHLLVIETRPGGRYPLTTTVRLDRARLMRDRLSELIEVAEAEQGRRRSA